MDCTEKTCPVSESIYGYRPNVPANAFFVALFGIAAIVQAAQGIKYRTWTYCIAMVCGCVLESIGHAGRILLHDDPFGEVGFNLQICTLTMAPAFLAAAVYLMLKHLVLATSPSLSRIPPRYYTYIFISADFTSLVLQAAGGGTAATASSGDATDLARLANGEHIMMAGLSFQVLTLLILLALSLDYCARARRAPGPSALWPESAAGPRRGGRFAAFAGAQAVAFAAILARCAYRVVEMAGGWRNAVMQNEVGFIVLDSSLCSLAVLALTLFHPGFCFNYRAINRDELLLERERRRRCHQSNNSSNNSNKEGDQVEKVLSDGSSTSASSPDISDAEMGKAISNNNNAAAGGSQV